VSFSRRIGAATAVLTLSLFATTARGEVDDSSCWVGSLVSGAIGAGTGVGASLLSSGIIVSVDDSRDYHFATGALVGSGVTVGLAALFAIVDGSSGCTMTRDGIAWSVPIVTLVLGGALPVAIWGAAEEHELSGTAQSGLSPAALQWRW